MVIVEIGVVTGRFSVRLFEQIDTTLGNKRRPLKKSSHYRKFSLGEFEIMDELFGRGKHS